MRDQDGAQVSFGQWTARALSPHHLRRRLPRPHAGDHRRRRATQNISKASVRRSRASTRSPFGDYRRRARRRSDRDTAGDTDRADPGRGRRARLSARASCAACGSSATRTACCSFSTRCNAASAAPASFLAWNMSGVAPDIVALAKGIGGGFPLGACLATREAAKGMTLGAHGSTFGGNPLATSVGNAVLDVVLRAGLSRARRAAWARCCVSGWRNSRIAIRRSSRRFAAKG